MVQQSDTPRGQWPLGRIVEVNPGADGHVRAVKVSFGGKTFSRPITKICPLELHGSDLLSYGTLNTKNTENNCRLVYPSMGTRPIEEGEND